MDNKKEIGRKIWDLFLKKYSYSQIAKELNINKSVVSNIINYSMPPNDWCNEKIEEIRKTEYALKKQLNEKMKKIRILEAKNDYQSKTLTLILVAITVYLIIVPIVLYLININFYHSFVKVGLFFVVSIISIFAIYKILTFLKNWI